MKLIIILISIKWVAEVNAQKFRQEQFPFPPQFQSQNNRFYTSDSSLYLPPESHTTIPYYPIKNVDNLQFPYLPPTGTKAPSIYPTPFPLIISSSMVPNYEEDDDNEEHGRIKLTSPRPNQQKFNQSSNSPNPSRDMRSFPKMMYQQPIDRIDVRMPVKPPPTNPNPAPSSPAPTPVSQTPATRRMIISAETHRNDIGLDQIKSAAFPVNHYVGGPGNIFVSSSTTEPAIPILRLSNEMDLDGSFSYEALGADQTHYVQHSRMENMGSEKEEQVVEGSYSYVGDNGQTYTVHYIADSNGFRASGDHLPVAPPVPEIIQRAVQYNLAEEAKRPPHLKSWQDDGKDNSIGESDKNQHFAPPPPRNNLFTGRTPEAFSYSYNSQGSNTQNNLVAAASNNAPVKTVDINGVDASQSKPNNNANGAPISPQITFLASQGAHLPSANTISRMFSADKAPMPQLINYEAALKEAEENNKALWRWQYGINANNQINQNSQNKDTISRSFGEGDDVMINFSDMSPEQYTNMIRSQFEIGADSITRNHYSPNQQRQLTHSQNSFYENQNQAYTTNTNPEMQKPYVEYQNPNNDKSSNNQVYQPNVTQSFDYKEASPSVSTITVEEWYKQQGLTNHSNIDFSTTTNPEENKQKVIIKPVENVPRLIENKAKLITHHDFPEPSETITQSYNFEEPFYEPQRIRNIVNSPSTFRPEFNNDNDISVIGLRSTIKPAEYWYSTTTPVNLPEIITTTTSLEPFSTLKQNIKFTDFIVPGSLNSDFRPISTTTTTEVPTTSVPTTEASVQDIFQNNIFLKNFFNPVKTETKNDNRINNEPKKVVDVKITAEPKTDKIPKFIPFHPKPENEIKMIKKKPLDLADVLNYVSMKNHFESNKVKARNTQIAPVNKPSNVEQKNDIRFIPIQTEKNEESVNTPEPNQNGFRPLNFEQQQELRGLIKNYKVLQRNRNNMNKYESKELKTELSPPPLNFSQKTPGLPPLGRAGPSMKSYLPPIYV